MQDVIGVCEQDLTGDASKFPKWFMLLPANFDNSGRAPFTGPWFVSFVPAMMYSIIPSSPSPRLWNKCGGPEPQIMGGENESWRASLAKGKQFTFGYSRPRSSHLVIPARARTNSEGCLYHHLLGEGRFLEY